MNKGVIVLVIGILLLLVSLLADTFGFGNAGFGTRQIGGAVAGAVIAVIGLVMKSRGAKGGSAA